MKNTICRNILSFLASPCRISLTWVPWMICLTGFLTCIALYYPGRYYQDQIVQYFQAEWGLYADWHPPIMAATWRFLRILYQTLTGAVVPGDGLLYVLYLSFFWVGGLLVLLAAKDFWRNTSSKPWYLVFASIVAIGLFFIEFFGELDWISKDIGMTGAYLIAVGCLLNWPLKKHWQWGVGFTVLFFLFYGTALRHNTLLALLPLTCWLARRMLPQRKPVFVVVGGICLWITILGTIHWFNYHLLQTIRLYPLSERFYADIFQLNARTKNYVLPPDTFGHQFAALDEKTFRRDFVNQYLLINHSFEKISIELPQYAELTQNYIIYPSAMHDAYVREGAQWKDFRGSPIPFLVVDEASVRNRERDYRTLRKAWIERVCMNPKEYLAFKTWFFARFCIKQGLRFPGISVWTLLVLLTLTLAPPLCRPCRLIDGDSFPRVMLGASAWLYLMPYWMFLPDDAPRYTYWFLAASMVSLMMFCNESPLIRSLVRKTTNYWTMLLRRRENVCRHEDCNSTESDVQSEYAFFRPTFRNDRVPLGPDSGEP